MKMIFDPGKDAKKFTHNTGESMKRNTSEKGIQQMKK